MPIMKKLPEDDSYADRLQTLWAKHEEIYGACAHPVLADLVLARTWLEEALASADLTIRVANAARAAHVLDAVLQRVSTLSLPEELRHAVDAMAAELRSKLERA
jgi:hypothetical protein